MADGIILLLGVRFKTGFPPPPMGPWRTRQQPIAGGIHPAARSGMRKTGARVRPDGRRGLFSKEALVALQRRPIPILELRLLSGSSPGGLMVQFPAQHPATQLLPITLRINQMEMPGLIDRFRGRHRMARFHCQQEKSFILPHHACGKGVGPCLLPGQTAGEWQGRPLFIKGKSFDPLTEWSVAGRVQAPDSLTCF